MTPYETWESALAECPLVAILRGVQPGEVAEIGLALVEAGFKLIEVPLNSPEPFESIARLTSCLRGRAMVGAGTVLASDQVDQVAAAGGTMIISPNADPNVIERTRELGMVSIPGVFTPGEAFAALAAGANALKIFPAELASPSSLRALRAVLSPPTKILVVGGIGPETMPEWRKAGANGFGVGSALYKPGRDCVDVASRAGVLVAASKVE